MPSGFIQSEWMGRSGAEAMEERGGDAGEGSRPEELFNLCHHRIPGHPWSKKGRPPWMSLGRSSDSQTCSPLP